MNHHFNYYYGQQAETYSFYRIPKALFKNPYFKNISTEAKVLYGLMLDRMSLSMSNKWFDEQNRVYIIFTVEDVEDLLGCCHQKAVKLLAELDSSKGIGLIEKKRLGFGKANIIYVKNFIMNEEVPSNTDTEQPCPEEDDEEEFTGEIPEESADTEAVYSSNVVEPENIPPEKGFPQKSKNHTSRSMKNILQEVPNSYFKKYEKHTSRSSKNILQEVPESYPNYTDINKTDRNKTDSNQSIKMEGRIDVDKSAIRDAYLETIKENIGYDVLCSQYDNGLVDEIVTLLLDTVCTSQKELRIGKEVLPAEVVRARLLKLNLFHIQYVMDSFLANKKKKYNVRTYLLTALYNASGTMNHYYADQVNHDLYG